jgi:Uma2 family endonuclease
MNTAVRAFSIQDPGASGYTVADLHSLNDPRFELIDGCLVGMLSATPEHNLITRWIANAIEGANPGDDHFVGTGLSADIDDHNEPRPDIVVARIEHIKRTPFPITDALLVAEVVSPTSTLRDTEMKRALYARAGVPAYWIIAPSREKPEIALAELVLEGGSYRYVTHYTTDVVRTDRPWPVEIDLPALSERRGRLLRRAGG